jgi:hypothetical protein
MVSANYSARWIQTLQELCGKLAGAVRMIEMGRPNAWNNGSFR